MSNQHLLFFGLVYAALGFPALAAPLVILPVGDMSCSVEVTASDSLASSKSPTPVPSTTGAPKMTHIQITRVGNLQRNTVTWSDGATTETWKALDAGLTMVETAYPVKSIYDIPVGSLLSSIFLRPILDMDPASVNWITDASFVGKETHSGKLTFHYRAPVLIPSTLPRHPPVQVFYEGWIDLKTLVPVAFDDGTQRYELTFSAPPTDPLVLPDRFQKDLQYYQRANSVGHHL